MSNSVKQRNYCLDFVKLVACIFIVLRHCIVLGDAGEIMVTLTRCFVPFFFIVSGYYCFRGEGVSEKSLKPKITHIAKITFWTCLLYVIVTAFFVLVFNERSDTALAEVPVKLLKLVLLNHPFFIPELVWFLFATLYVYFVYALVKKFNLYKLAYILIPVFFCVFIFLTRGLELFDIVIPNYYYRNFLIEAFPFFMFGHLVHRYEHKIRIPSWVLWLILVTSSVLVFFEARVLGTEFDLNVMSFVQAIAIFLLAVKHRNFGKGVLSDLGRDLSMYVYIFHIVVRRVVFMAYSILGLSLDVEINRRFVPLLVIVGALIVSFVWFHLVKFVGNKIKKKN
ncbi:MAG: acyltransferase [Clostridia bacterium]|nr:acyltransferase [Clostridia bacterium]